MSNHSYVKVNSHEKGREAEQRDSVQRAVADLKSYRDQMRICLVEKVVLENENKELKKDVKMLHDRIARIDDYKKSIVHDRIEKIRGNRKIMSKSPSQSKGGKTKRNKFRRSKYRITKRNY